MINSSEFCMDYVLYIYKSTKYIRCFNEHLVTIESIMHSTDNMVQTMGIRIYPIFKEKDPIEITFWVGKKWSEFNEEVEKMSKYDYTIEANNLAVSLYKKILDSVISKLQDTLQINSAFNPKILVDDNDYDIILKKELNREYIIEQAIKYALEKQGGQKC